LRDAERQEDVSAGLLAANNDTLLDCEEAGRFNSSFRDSLNTLACAAYGSKQSRADSVHDSDAMVIGSRSVGKLYR
jgi:hypothetical protein